MYELPAWLTHWLEDADLVDEGRRAIADAWRLEPARPVRATPYNAPVMVPSPKNGKLYEAESRTVERAWFWIWEYDARVLGWVPQPAAPVLHLEYVNKDGRRISHNHVADALLIEPDGAYLVDLKTEQALVGGAEAYPGLYVRRPLAEGGWQCPPLEAAAAPWGLKVRILSDAQLPQVLLRNLEFLRPYYR